MRILQAGRAAAPRREPTGQAPTTPGSRSDDKGFIGVQVPVQPVNTDHPVPLALEDVDPQAVLLRINDSQELGFQFFELCLCDPAFKHRELHTLTVTFAEVRDPAQPRLTILANSVDIVRNKYIEAAHVLLRREGSVIRKIASQNPGQQSCLNLGHKTNRYLLLQ